MIDIEPVRVPQKRVILCLTGRCNLHCCSKSVLDIPDDDLTFAAFARLFTKNKDIQFWLLRAQGEPMLNPDFGKIARFLLAHGKRVSLVTNGTLLQALGDSGEHVPWNRFDEILLLNCAGKSQEFSTCKQLLNESKAQYKLLPSAAGTEPEYATCTVCQTECWPSWALCCQGAKPCEI